MTALLPRAIDWIELAPISITASAESAASPEEIFAVLADHERWPEWFPGVKKVEVTGAASGVGARRRVSVPGAVVDEEFIIWEPGVRWSFTGTAARPGVTKSLIEDCRLEALPSGGTRITYAMYLDPPRALLPLVKLAARQIRRNNRRAMVNLAERAAHRHRRHLLLLREGEVRDALAQGRGHGDDGHVEALDALQRGDSTKATGGDGGRHLVVADVLDERGAGGQRLAATRVDVVADHVVPSRHGPHGEGQAHIALPDDDGDLCAHPPIMHAAPISRGPTACSA